MRRFCIFCGENPISKNREHIIPQWLIKHTGDPNRIALLGGTEANKIMFSWINFVFPACENCNSNFAKIEAKVKPILENIENEQSITHEELDLFLDWIDKIRIGLWLGQAMLEKKDFEPNFFINDRVANKDRLCLLYKTKSDEKGIGIIGTSSLVFEHIPSCFALIINNLVVFNYSKEFLLAKNLGFPYAEKYSYTDDNLIVIEKFAYGTNNISFPIIDGKIIKPAIKFYQSIMSLNHKLKKPILGAEKRFIDANGLTFLPSRIQSRIFISDEQNALHQFWPKEIKKINFIFKEKFEKIILERAVAQMVFEHQNHSVDTSLNHCNEMSPEKKEELVKYYHLIKESNTSIIENLNDQLKNFYKYI